MSFALIIFFWSGFVSWWITGFHDDFFILRKIFKMYPKAYQRVSIFFGQLMGVIFLLSIGVLIEPFAKYVLSFEAISDFISSPNLLIKILSGVILICIGIWFILSSDNDYNKEDRQKPRYKYIIIISFMLYILNAADDLTVISASLLSYASTAKYTYCAGFILGWASSFFIALKSLNINRLNIIEKFSPYILITGGIVVILLALIT